MQPIPVVLLTGFLGAGKTTLLNRMIAEPGFADTALIINEFGAVGIDAMLVEQADEGIVEMSDGCLCCTIRGDLADTLERVLTRNPAPKRIIIETTGLADPTPIVQTLIGHPVLCQQVSLAAIVTVLDAVNGPDTLNRFEEARRQLAMADWVHISKTDHTDHLESQKGALVERVTATNPSARLLKTDTANSLGLLSQILATPIAATRDSLTTDGAHNHGHHHHHHDVNQHGAIRAICLDHAGPIDRAGFEGFVHALRATQGEKLLRMKAVVQFTDAPDDWFIIHAAQQIVDAPRPLNASTGQRVQSPNASTVVLVLDGSSPDYIQELFNGFMNRPGIDTADRAALENNPLAIPGV
ncbi:MAG: GTP-binding protein [Pseudomonadota bacterium]